MDDGGEPITKGIPMSVGLGVVGRERKLPSSRDDVPDVQIVQQVVGVYIFAAGNGGDVCKCS
jgi:hypothetical protein